MSCSHAWAFRLESTPSPTSFREGKSSGSAIVRALVLRPSVLPLDEPTSALDRETSEGLARKILDLTRGSVTLVLVTHQQELARRMANRVLHLEHGVLAEPSQAEYAHDALLRASSSSRNF